MKQAEIKASGGKKAINKGRAFYTVLLSFLALTVFSPVALFSQSDEAPLNLSVIVPVRFNLEISSPFVSFTRAGLVTERQLIPANEGPMKLDLKIIGSQSANINIWLVASSDLRDQNTGYTIPVEAISWKAEGTGFYDGRLSKSAPALVARLSGSGSFTGNLYFYFDDDPKTYAPGTYQTVVTLVAGAI
ncbi:MAG: hypothetical protein ACPLPQ_02615 [Candidatus Saccharicenans sp.]